MAKESTGQAASKKQLIMIGVLFAALLGVVYFLFLKGGGEEPASSTAPPSAPAEQEAPVEDESDDKDEAEAPKKKSKGPVETSEVFGGKDPFEPVLDLTGSAAGDGGAGETDETDGTTDGTTDDGTGTVTPGGTTPTTPTTPTVPTVPTTPPDDDDDDVVKTGYSVTLLEVYTDNGTRKALVETVKRASGADKVHRLEVGDRFREYFKLTSLTNRCGTFLFGEELFGLCKGQRQILK